MRYGYDATNQLTSENAYDGPANYNYTQNFAYDAMGNRTAHQNTRNGITTRTTPSHNRLNQLVSVSQQNSGASNTRSWTGNDYDASGNLVMSRGVDGSRTLYVYDDLDRLHRIEWKSAAGSSTKKIEWVYDFANRKSVEREFTWNGGWVQSGYKKRIYSGMDVVQERDEQRRVTAHYTRDGNIGGILARSTGDGLTAPVQHTFYGYDGSGNVALLTDSSGAEVGRYSYDAFGQTIEMSGARAAENPFRFSTKELHAALGLYDYGYRFYNPGTGRWLNRDPLGEGGGLNLYAAMGNSPTSTVDEYGLLGVSVDFGRGWKFSTPLYGRGGPDFLFDRSSTTNLGKDVEKGWYPAADGLNPFGDPYKEMGYWNECDDESKWSYNLGQVSQQALVQAGTGGLGSAAGKFATGAKFNGLQTVSRWGRPGLQPGDWVMKGPGNRWNYLRSFKWERTPWNKPASFNSGTTYVVPKSSIRWPTGWGHDGWWKGLFGQRIYKP